MSLKRFIDCIWDKHICGALILSWCMELYLAELEPLIICRTRGEHVNHHATDVACVFYMFSIYGFNISCIEWHFLCKCNAQLNIYQIKALYHWPINLWRLLWLHWSLWQYNLLALKVWKYNKIGYICVNNWWHIKIHSYVKWIDVICSSCYYNKQCYTSLQLQVSNSYLWTYSSGNWGMLNYN